MKTRIATVIIICLTSALGGWLLSSGFESINQWFISAWQWATEHTPAACFIVYGTVVLAIWTFLFFKIKNNTELEQSCAAALLWPLIVSFLAIVFPLCILLDCFEALHEKIHQEKKT